MPSRDQSGGEQGLSLVEMAVALLIVGLVLAALASSLTTSLRAVRGQEATTQATAAINDILEEAQRVDYDAAVLCDTAATAAFGGTTFEGEDLVVSSGVCGAADEVLPKPPPVTRDGREYEVTTAITWADDPADGLGVADVDSTQDIKRIVVDVAWTADGQARTARNIAYRAPQFLEQLITAEVEDDDGKEFIVIDDDAIDDGENAEAFTLRAIAQEKLSAVQVSWVDRTGAVESHPMVATASDGLVWEYNLHSNFGPFANGGTLFTFDATSTSGDTETVTARGLFLYNPMAVLLVGGKPIQNNFGGTFTVSEVDGTVCPDQWLEMDVEGAIRSDLASATWNTGPTTIDSLTSVTTDEALAVRGARFRLDLSGRDDFATYDATNAVYEPITNGVVQARITVDRIVDDTSTAAESENLFIQVGPC